MSYRKNNYTPKGKNKWAKILAVVACVLVVCALCGLIPNLFNHKDGDFERVYVGWTVGGLSTDDGMFDSEVKDTMVSDPIDIEGGFKIKPDFESGITYDIYLYDENDNFIETYGLLFNSIATESADILLAGSSGTDHYRIVLHPVDKNNIINVFEKWKYANLLEIYKAPLEEKDKSSNE